MKIYIVKENYSDRSSSNVSAWSDKENADIDCDILNSFIEDYNNCHYKNPRREHIKKRINMMGGSEYASSYEVEEMEVK
jgi:hypothetical protein